MPRSRLRQTTSPPFTIAQAWVTPTENDTMPGHSSQGEAGGSSSSRTIAVSPPRPRNPAMMGSLVRRGPASIAWMSARVHSSVGLWPKGLSPAHSAFVPTRAQWYPAFPVSDA
ncbi:MAG: hypothetical protein AAF799_27555 [Myxococcota bacterium]